MVTVGVDTYVTAAEADEYIAKYYRSTDNQRTAWETAGEDDKEVILRRACAAVDSLPYRGVKFAYPQVLAFPRYFGTNYAMISGVLHAGEVDQYPELREVPEAIKHAQIEEALELIAPSAATEYMEAVTGPVESYSIGHLSETYRTTEAGSLDAVIASGKAKEMLRPYVGGGYGVCD